MLVAETLEDLQPHAQLGHYTIVSHVADGGMGHVFKAFEPKLQREVAIKVLKPELAENSQYIAFFEEEAQRIASLRHPNIVPIYFIGQQGQLSYFVMAFIEGGATLDNWIEAETPLSTDQASWIMNQATDALDAALKHQIIHLDIKPSNFLVDSNGSILLTDFGLARSLSPSSQDEEARECFGTPAYMCPEQILSRPTDQRSDIYSLGATMYHLMTLQFLHDGETVEEIIMSHVNNPFPYKQAESLGLSPGWIALFDKMTQKKPEDRYQNYEDLRTDLYRVDSLRLNIPLHVEESTEEDTPNEPIPVPHRGSESKAYLYGLLSPGCSAWADSGIDRSVKKTRAELLNLIQKPLHRLHMEDFTNAFLELQTEEATELNDLDEALSLAPQVGDFILRLAATRFCGSKETKDSKEALQAVGLPLARKLILTSVILRNEFPRFAEFNFWPFWQHSISTGLLTHFLLQYADRDNEPQSLGKMTTKVLSNLIKLKVRRLAYFAGLSHDFGKLVLAEIAPYSLYAPMRLAMENTTPEFREEKDLIGIDHHEIGTLWAERFPFESPVKDVIGRHYMEKGKPPLLTAAVMLANQLAKRNGLGFSGNPVVEYRDVTKSPAWKVFKKEVKNKDFTAAQFDQEFTSFVGELPLLSYS
jgi:serine/threonine protein kinase